jgi:class 3 adenylate cyclase
VDKDTFAAAADTGSLSFEALPSIGLKGYAEPVPVFAASPAKGQTP